MTVTSMTGFARVDGESANYSWVWEVKSVNSKGLDLRFRLPHGFDQIESEARTHAAKKFSRGNLSINLTLQRPEKAPALAVNRDVLEKMTALAAEVRGSREAVNVESLMSLRGVVEVIEDDAYDDQTVADRDAAIVATLRVMLDKLADARLSEGERLFTIVADHIEEIGQLTSNAAELAELQPERRKSRLMQQLAELLDSENPVSEERVAQELALIVARGDVREELDRLASHVSAARDLMSEGGPIGRRLDFLCQEFNREANTLCSKSTDMELTRIGLALKAAIERLREQTQNIE